MDAQALPEAPVVLVTGASGGIGRAVAISWARRGGRLVLLARSRGLLEALAAECEREGGTAVVETADVTDEAAIRDVITRTVATHGRLDVVVHSAAVVTYGRLAEVPEEVWDRTVDVGVRGTVIVARQSLRVFEPAGFGHLVIIGSVLGQITSPFMGAYSMSKWAVHGLVRTLQQEARQTPGVKVSMVSPGGIDTAIYRTAATYVGRHGSPPPPVHDPEAVARAVLKAVDGGGARDIPVGVANYVMRLGFTVTPRIYDALVTPMMKRLGMAKGVVAPTEGNVFRATEDMDRVTESTP